MTPLHAKVLADRIDRFNTLRRQVEQCAKLLVAMRGCGDYQPIHVSIDGPQPNPTHRGPTFTLAVPAELVRRLVLDHQRRAIVESEAIPAGYEDGARPVSPPATAADPFDGMTHEQLDDEMAELDAAEVGDESDRPPEEHHPEPPLAYGPFPPREDAAAVAEALQQLELLAGRLDRVRADLARKGGGA